MNSLMEVFRWNSDQDLLRTRILRTDDNLTGHNQGSKNLNKKDQEITFSLSISTTTL